MKSRSQISSDELQNSLDRVLSEYFGAWEGIEHLYRRVSSYSSSYTIENLRVKLNDGKELRLILKNFSLDSLLPAARGVRPRFLVRADREIETYRKILQGEDLGTPTYYGAAQSEELNRHWLYLELVSGTLLWQIGEFSCWEEAARWLAMLHNRFDSSRRRLDVSKTNHLLKYDEDFLKVWPVRAEAFLRSREEECSREMLTQFRRIVDQYDRVIEHIVALPVTLIHGEFFPSNVIVRRGKGRPAICPIDWEMSALGPGLIDLAALISGDWNETEKQRMIAAYCESSNESPHTRIHPKDICEATLYCQLHLAMQLLGWADGWAPPKLHGQNWLREACTVGSKLGF